MRTDWKLSLITFFPTKIVKIRLSENHVRDQVGKWASVDGSRLLNTTARGLRRFYQTLIHRAAVNIFRHCRFQCHAATHERLVHTFRYHSKKTPFFSKKKRWTKNVWNLQNVWNKMAQLNFEIVIRRCTMICSFD